MWPFRLCKRVSRVGKDWTLFLTIVLAVLFVLIFCDKLLFQFPPSFWRVKTESKSPFSMAADSDGNHHDGLAWLINTTNCKIQEFHPQSPTTLALLQRRCNDFDDFYLGEPNCDKINYQNSWSYVNGTHLHINLTAVKAAGYSWNSIRCCYRVIIRVEQKLTRSDKNADNRIRYSDICYPVTDPVEYLPYEFIRLHCISTSVPLYSDVVSRDFLANVFGNARAQKKFKKQRVHTQNTPKQLEPGPPNIIILGMDTMSRLNVHRTLPKTLSLLQSMGAVEMKGYTKVGENTFPNALAFMTGYTKKQFKNTCNAKTSNALDNCPFAWNSFKKLGYLTALIEDTVQAAVFNYMTKGFVRSPVDFYFRPFMLAVQSYLPRHVDEYLRCLGRRQIHDVTLRYLEEALKVASGTPLFSFFWTSCLAHDCSLNARHADDLFVSYIQKFTTGKNNNTILIFLGDHGEIFAYIRETEPGWYEAKLPAFWIYLPDGIREKYSQWYRSLQINSNRLTSHFDMYKTLIHILKAFDKDKVANETYKRLKGQLGKTLFQPVAENRSCDDAGIPAGYCACYPPLDTNMSDPRIAGAAAIGLKSVSNLLPLDLCEQPTLKMIKNARSFTAPRTKTNTFIVTFVTEPGEFLFEATVKQPTWITSGVKGMELASPVTRINKMAGKVNCVKDRQLQKYCYCK